MKARCCAIVFLIFCFSILGAQNKKKQTPPVNDLTVSLHEETINKVLAAIGDIHGTSDYEVMLISGKYEWWMKNARINIRPDSSQFVCDAIVKVSLFEYSTQVLGDVKISYDSEKNLIYVKITRAIFELYTIIFGKKMHIKNIHLEDHFKEPFAFEGPRTITTDIEFTLPDSTKRKVYMAPTDCRMEVKWKEICTSCEIEACNTPPAPKIKIVPPIEGIRPSTVQPAVISTVQPAPAQKK